MSFQKAAIVLISILLATTTYADDGDDIEPLDFCRDLSLIANEVMTTRQRDKPMSEAIPIATDRLMQWAKGFGYEMDMDEAEEIAAGMVMDAYEKMISSTDMYKKLRITEFENLVFKECYEQWTSELDVDDAYRDAVPESTPGMWAVQLEVFSDIENAEAFAADLRRQGYAAFLSQVQSETGSLHRVRIGPQKDMASSESVAARLLEAGYKGEIVPHP